MTFCVSYLITIENKTLKSNALDPRCSGQAHSNRPGTVYRYESMEPVRVLTVLSVPYVIRPIKSPDA